MSTQRAGRAPGNDREVPRPPKRYSLAEIPPGWSPLDDYRAAGGAAGRVAADKRCQEAILSRCTCANCQAQEVA